MSDELSCHCGNRDPAKSHCALCHENTDSLPDMVHHLRQFHPDHYEEPERWPDGGLVMPDGNPEIEDFLTPQQVRVPAQNVEWTCAACLKPCAVTVLWYTLEPTTVRCPHCTAGPLQIQPPQL